MADFIGFEVGHARPNPGHRRRFRAKGVNKFFTLGKDARADDFSQAGPFPSAITLVSCVHVEFSGCGGQDVAWASPREGIGRVKSGWRVRIIIVNNFYIPR